MKALVVDDSQVSRLVLSRYLTDAGCAVTLAEDAESALAAWRADPEIDLVITDLWLPLGSGEDLCREIRRLEAGRQTHLVVVSGLSEGTELQRSLAAGADLALPKPAARTAIQQLVAQLKARSPS